MESKLTLRIVLEKPPPEVDFGLQKGRGTNYETIQTQRSKTQDLSFEFSIALKANSRNAAPDFSGPFVQGTQGGRFVYLDIGTYAGQKATSWSRRLKVPLSGITRDLIDRVGKSGSVLEARVPGTGKDGGPNCATVKPFPGWKPARSTRE